MADCRSPHRNRPAAQRFPNRSTHREMRPPSEGIAPAVLIARPLLAALPLLACWPTLALLVCFAPRPQARCHLPPRLLHCRLEDLSDCQMRPGAGRSWRVAAPEYLEAIYTHAKSLGTA